MKAVFSWFCIQRARYLSRHGSHAKALALSNMNDVQVLSKAGMHLLVLECANEPSVERALALAKIGEIDAAISMAKAFTEQQAAKSLFGYLATLAPDRVLPIIEAISGLENVKAYCRYQIGVMAFSEENQENLAPLHVMTCALLMRNKSCAKKWFEAFFSEFGLITPSVEWLPGGLRYGTLSCKKVMKVGLSGPLISVILTAYNEEKYLAIAVNSLLAQSWQNLEIIFVNDASKDNTLILAEALADQDHRIRIVNLEKNGGLWAAKNAGLQHCKGEIITMHDADDWSHPLKLERQVAPLLKDKTLLATSSYMVRIDENSGVPFTRNACNYMRWNPSSFMFRSGFIKHHGGFRDDVLGSDCEYVARIETLYGVKSHRCIRLPLSIGLQRQHSLSNRFRTEKQEQTRISHWESWRKSHAFNLNSYSGVE